MKKRPAVGNDAGSSLKKAKVSAEKALGKRTQILDENQAAADALIPFISLGHASLLSHDIDTVDGEFTVVGTGEANVEWDFVGTHAIASFDSEEAWRKSAMMMHAP